jgi:hypothetical protein
MQNVNIKVVGSKLVIEVDCSKSGVPSKSGKSEVIATTGGNQAYSVGGKQVSVGVNAFVKV